MNRNPQRHSRFRASVGTLLSVAIASAVGTTGCGDNIVTRTPIVREDLKLTAVRDTVVVKPGGTARVAFVLKTPEGVGVAGQRLDFQAIDDPQTPTSDFAGATLSAPSGLTDADGVGAVTVTGGLPTQFRLAARQGRAASVAEALIIVPKGDQGTIAVVAAPVVGSKAASTVTTVDVMLFDTRTCSDLSVVKPPQPVRPTRAVSVGVPAEFAIDNMEQNAVVGQGRDADGMLRAAGCIDVPGKTVIAESTVRVYLPLADTDPVPGRDFRLASHFALARRDLTRQLAAPWQDLGDCPLDPSQLWLDCALDALGSPAGDALDCMPSPNEGDLANVITARRGSATTGSPCRAATVTGGAQALDAKVAALFPNPAQAPAADIDTLGETVASMLDNVIMGSTLSFSPTAVAGMFQATHTLRSASFQVGGQAASVDIVAQGTPNSQVRYVPVTTTGDLLSVGAHRMGLRLGTLARIAFGTGALAARGLPTATPAFLDVLFGLATNGVGATRKTGCDALDAFVCTDVGRAAGCLRSACLAGQAALAARLDAAFLLWDGDGADFQLSGSAAMTDETGDGVADRLGATSQSSGLWTAQIRTSTGTENVSGSWSGSVEPP